MTAFFGRKALSALTTVLPSRGSSAKPVRQSGTMRLKPVEPCLMAQLIGWDSPSSTQRSLISWVFADDDCARPGCSQAVFAGDAGGERVPTRVCLAS